MRSVPRHSGSGPRAANHPLILCDSEIVGTPVSSSLNAIRELNDINWKNVDRK